MVDGSVEGATESDGAADSISEGRFDGISEGISDGGCEGASEQSGLSFFPLFDFFPTDGCSDGG